MMKRILVIVLVATGIAGCSSNKPKQELLIEAAQACSNICENHPQIEGVSSAAGAGIPLLFIGGMESSCQCVR